MVFIVILFWPKFYCVDPFYFNIFLKYKTPSVFIHPEMMYFMHADECIVDNVAWSRTLYISPWRQITWWNTAWKEAFAQVAVVHVRRHVPSSRQSLSMLIYNRIRKIYRMSHHITARFRELTTTTSPLRSRWNIGPQQLSTRQLLRLL
jgi:hypothetical protein